MPANAKQVKSDTHTAFESFTAGWVNSGFDRRTTEIRARKVIGGTSGVPEVQIEITITEFKGANERRYQHSGELTLTPEQAAILAKSLVEARSWNT